MLLQKQNMIDIYGNTNKRITNISNQKFNNLTAVKFLYRKNKSTKWLFKCVCGKEKELCSNDVVSYRIKSCGCLHHNYTRALSNISHKKHLFFDNKTDESVITQDFRNIQFHKLQAINFLYMNRTQHSCKAIWEFACSCGSKIISDISTIKRGLRKSCGCQRVQTKETLTKKFDLKNPKIKKTYNCWLRIQARCYNKNNDSYADYGGRGISVSEFWKTDFSVFLQDMGLCPNNHSIERINVNGNYEKNNCKWATTSEQIRNRRKTLFVIYNNEKMTLIDCVEHHSPFSYGLVWSRLKRKWPLEQALKMKPDLCNAFLRRAINSSMSKIEYLEYFYE
jgi:hypothetical protein